WNYCDSDEAWAQHLSQVLKDRLLDELSAGSTTSRTTSREDIPESQVEWKPEASLILHV
ncbi:hypothetical protein L916_11613, partial [Phytophthora nicotianae]